MMAIRCQGRARDAVTRVRPFCGWHYDWGRFRGPEVICPPYDVIDSDQRERLLAASPYNAVRLILPGQIDDGDRYERARATLERWKAEGILVQEQQPAFYLYRQTFQTAGQIHTRTGFFAAVGLQEFGTGSIYAHEETLSAPKEDRFRILEATRTNLSPVFGLLDDEDGQVTAALREAPVGPALRFEEGGTGHELVPLRHKGFQQRLMECSEGRPVFIADGHHRYETALRYYLQGLRDDDPEDPRASVLMFCVPTDDPGLLILPTHRVLERTDPFSLEELREELNGVVQFGDPVEDDDVTNLLQEALLCKSAPHTFAFVLDRGRKGALGRWVGPDANVVSIAGVQLDVLILHRMILPRLEHGERLSVSYSHDLAEVRRRVQGADNRTGVLLSGTPLDSMIRVARQRTRLPAKTTFFFPKVPTALVFRALNG